MFFSKFLVFIKTILPRTWLAYLFLAVLTFLFVDVRLIDSRIKIRRINDARPPMENLVLFSEGVVPSADMDWAPYLKYFNTIIKYMPQEEVSRMFLGVCMYYADEKKQTAAAALIRRSADAYPFLFWNMYNAGLLAFKQGDLKLSSDYFEKVLLIPADQALKVIQTSIVYRQMMSSSVFDINIMERVNEARAEAYLFLAAASFYSGNYEKARNQALYPVGKMPLKDPEPFFFYAGAASMRMGDPASALAWLGECIKRRTRNPLVYRYAAELLMASGKKDAAADLLRAEGALQARRPEGFPYPEWIRPRFF